MKIIGIVLTGIVALAVGLSLMSFIWFMPKDTNGIKSLLIMLNIAIAGGFAGRTSELFYKWFKSNLK